MPKYCSVPHCRTTPGDRKSFYKFPLHDPARLHLWLRNMGRTHWTPSRHQYICHEHFTPSNFKVRWGIRYLENNAVPTLFQKERVTLESERRLAGLWTNDNQSVKEPQCSKEEDDAPVESCSTDILQQCESGDLNSSIQTDNLASKDHPITEMNFQLTLLHAAEDFSATGGNIEMVLASEDQEGFTTFKLTEGDVKEGSLSFEDLTCTTEDFYNVLEEHQTQDVAYFEVLPSAFSTQLTVLPETILSSALSSKPITSTLPIVSKHVQSSESMGQDTEEEDCDEVGDNNTGFEYQQQMEHCYHKNSLTKEQLELVVVELQKKVKILQQRHRRHLDKLQGLEQTVSQLRQSNLLYEERLQLLERAFLQTNVATHSGEIMAIIYEDENSEYYCTPVNVLEETF